MAPVRRLPTRGYQRYATSRALLDLYRNMPQLFEKLVKFIAETLKEDYSYHPTSFPSAQKDENAEQRATRATMIQDWVEFLDEDLGIDWLQSPPVKIYTLNALFYAIWNAHWHPLSSTTKKPASSARLSTGNSSILLTAEGNAERLGNIKPAEMLEYALPKIEELQATRYGSLLASRNNWVASMKESLREPVWQISQKPHIRRQEQSIIDIGGDITSNRPAIYLHIIWHQEDDEDDFFLYVGQAGDLAHRLQDHNNPLYRIRHPSLHYYVWDSRPRMCSAFVVLAYLDVVEQTTGKLPLTEEEHLKMNILELWGCLIFQTMSECELRKYMDPTTMVRRRHLNVANPLWQTFTTAEDELVGASNSERFKVLLREADELTREYYRSLQAEFFRLKDSVDPTLKAYYYSRMERSVAGLARANARKLKQTLQGLMAGQS